MAETKKINATVDLVKSGVEFKLNGGTILSDDGTSHYLHSQSNLYLYSGSSNTMVLTNSGNVGIGTTSPNRPLTVETNTTDVLGALKIKNAGTGDASMFFAVNASGTVWQLGIDNSDGDKFKIGQDNSNADVGVGTKLTIDTSGNVGIGTSSPSYPLEVAATSTVSLAYQRTGVSAKKWGFHSDNSNTYWQNLTDNVLAFTLSNAGNVGIGTTSPGTELEIGDGTGSPAITLNKATTGTATLFFDNGGNNKNWIKADAAESLVFATNNTANVTIKEGGNVGIGTTNPLAALHINKSGVPQLLLDAGGNTTGDIVVPSGEVLQIGHWNTSNSTYTDRLRITAEGNVGIGTTSPNHKLDIYSNENVPLRIHRPSNANLDSSGAWGIGFSTRGDANTSTTDTRAGIFSYYNGNLFLATNNASIVSDPDAYARLTILNGGNVGIGTTSPSKKLQVKGELGIERSGTTAVNTISSEGNFKFVAATGYAMTFTSQGSEMVRFYNGNVGIGTTSPGFKLQVNHGTGAEYVSSFRNTNDNLQIKIGTTTGNLLNIQGATINTNAAYNIALQADGGKVGIGTTSPGEKLTISGKVLSYGGTGTVGAGTSYFLGNSASSRDIALTRVDSGALGIGRYNSGWLETMRFTIDGKVGIGTTSPAYALDIKKDATSILNLYRPNSSTAAVSDLDFSFNTANATESVYARIRADVETNTDSAQGGDLSFHTANSGTVSEKLRITQEGNVGIGTTNPTYKLTVQGNGINLAGTGAFLRWNSGDMQIKNEGSYKMGFHTYNTTAAALVNRMVIDTDGKVGIGTTSPQSPLTVKSNSSSSASSGFTLISNATNNIVAAIGERATDGGRFHLYDAGVEKVAFYSDGSNNHISAGSVGIGTTSPSKKLHISDDNDAPLRVESTDPTTGIDFKDNSNSSQLYYVGGSDHFYIPSGTSLGVGASSPTLGSMLRVYSNQTTADESAYGSYFDFNTSGSDTLTANRTQAAVYVDADSSTTGGGTASGTEHRFYGIYADVRASGDSDYIGGITARSEANATSGQVTNTRGGEFLAVSDGSDSGATHSNVTGTLSAAYAEDAATINSLEGARSYAYVNSNRTADITTLTGHSSEVEINADNTYDKAYLYRGTLDINSTHTITDTYAFRYDISGTSVATNNWGIFIDDVDKNYLSGKLGIGTTSPAATLDVSGGSLKVQSGDTFGYDGTAAAIYIDDSSGKGLSGKFGGNGYSRNLIKSDGSATIQIGENTSLISRILLDAGSTSANGYISLQTNQSERLRVTTDGDVGIGTTSPDTKLHIYENAAAPVLLTLNNYQGDINPNGSQGNFIDFKMTDDNATFTPQVRIGMIVKDSDGDSGLISEGCGNFVVYTGEGTDQGGSGTLTEHFRITDKGKVGIGTASPGQKLQVEGAISAGTANSTEGSLILVGKYSNGNIITIGGGYSGGGVVIGYGVKPSTTAAGAFLSSSALSNLERSAYVQYGSIHQWWTGAYQTVAVDSAATLTQSMTLDGSGNLGIGTTSPGAKLHANASSGVAFKVSPNSTSKEWYIDTTNPDHLKKEENLVLSADPGNTHTNTVIGFRIDNSTKMQIKSDGKVGIGTTSPAYLLDVSGTIRATGDVIAYSDARVKENVETIPNALDKVKGMRGVGYNKIGEEKRSVGVIAQELLEVLPEAVHQDDQGMYSVAYGNIVGVLIESIKELENRVEALEQKIKQNGITE